MGKADEIQRRFNELFGRVIQHYERVTSFLAFLGDADGNIIVKNPDGTTRPGYAWARVKFGDDSTLSVVPIRCRKVVRQPNLAVRVRRSPIDDALEAIEEDPVYGPFFTGDRGVNLPEHRWSHGRFGPDPLYIDTFMYLPLLTHPHDDGGLKVYVEPLLYSYGGQAKLFEGAELDLSAFVPSSGQTVVFAVLDPSTNTLEVVESGLTASPLPYASKDNIPFTALQVINALNTKVSGKEPSSAIRLYDGQTEIALRDIFLDLRPGRPTYTQGYGEFLPLDGSYAMQYHLPLGHYGLSMYAYDWGSYGLSLADDQWLIYATEDDIMAQLGDNDPVSLTGGAILDKILTDNYGDVVSDDYGNVVME